MSIDIGIDKPYKIFTDFVEEGAIDQFKNCMQQDWVLRGALLPDCHQGFTLCIGGVVETKGMISPSFVGVN